MVINYMTILSVIVILVFKLFYKNIFRTYNVYLNQLIIGILIIFFCISR